MKAYYDQRPEEILKDNDGTTVLRANITEETVTDEESETQKTFWSADECRFIGEPSITARQLRSQFILMGLDFSQIDDALEQLEEPDKSLAKVNWEYASIFERNYPLLMQVAQILGLDNGQVNEIFIKGNLL